MAVEIRVVRHLPCSVEQAYAWLTDYRDDDPQRAGALVTHRRVLERTERHAVFEGEHRALGKTVRYRQAVRLDPPAAWRSLVVDGPRAGSRNAYRLEATPRGARLVVEYHLVHAEPATMLLMRLARPLLRRRIVRMWEGYEGALAADLAEGRREANGPERVS